MTMSAVPAVVACAALLPSFNALKVSSNNCGGAAMSYAEYAAEFGRSFLADSPAYKMREAIYAGRVAEMQSHNCGEHGWEAGINHLTDWSDAELSSLTGYKRTESHWSNVAAAKLHANSRTVSEGFEEPPAFNFPVNHSWAHLDAIKENKDQEECGSCWAYAADAVMRSHAEINGHPHKFSIQQVVSCTPNPRKCGGTGGCDGATSELAFEYILRKGLAKDGAFEPEYDGTDWNACPPDLVTKEENSTVATYDKFGLELHKHTKPNSQIGMIGWMKFPENKMFLMKKALVENGPVVIGVAAGKGWFSYKKGIMMAKACEKGYEINHAVTLFGYGETEGADSRKFWSIKNSWGNSWGEKGSLRMVQGKNEEKTCGWDNKPHEGFACEGASEKVWACGTCGLLYDTIQPIFTKAVKK